MILYTKVTRFSERTGEKLIDEWVESSEHVCDFSGKLMTDDIEERPMYLLKVDYNNDCEEIWYYDKDQEFFTDKEVDYGSIFRDPFCYAINEDLTDQSVAMVQEWLLSMSVGTKPGYLSKCATIEEVMRMCRIRVIKNALKTKTYSLEQLGMKNDN